MWHLLISSVQGILIDVIMALFMEAAITEVYRRQESMIDIQQQH